MDESALDFLLKSVKVSCAVESTVPPGGLDLTGFPLLVFDGKDVRTEDNGTDVSGIAEAFAGEPDRNAVASKFGTTADHVAEAVRYATRPTMT